MQTPKQQAASQRRSLAALRARVLNMSAAWGDVDEYFMSKLHSIYLEIEQIEKEMSQFIIDGGGDEQP